MDATDESEESFLCPNSFTSVWDECIAQEQNQEVFEQQQRSSQEVGIGRQEKKNGLDEG